jgi:dTDP-4-dehydrorhamnose reductase
MKPAKKKLLVIGATGMLGHTCFRLALGDAKFDSYGTARRGSIEKIAPADKNRVIPLDIENANETCEVIERIKPDYVINCAGVTKALSNDQWRNVRINSVAPHVIAGACSKIGARLVHVSTDCVFSGKKGDYSEADTPDADDLYGMSKLLGEVTYGSHLTIRTSMVGLEIGTRHGLLEWVLGQHGKIKGYSNAIFIGLGTIELSRVLMELAVRDDIKGLLNIGTEKLNKYDFCVMAKRIFGLKDLEIERDAEFRCDRSLNTGKMKKLGIKVPEMEQMLLEIKKELDNGIR